jgi:hypothetical protein
MFRFSAEEAFAALLKSAGLAYVTVQGHAFTYWVATPDARWTGALWCAPDPKGSKASRLQDIQRSASNSPCACSAGGSAGARGVLGHMAHGKRQDGL